MPRDLDYVPTPSPSPWAALYSKAADIIEKGGLVKNIQEDGLGRHCIIGALFKAHYGFAFPAIRVPSVTNEETWRLGAIWARDLGFGPASRSDTYLVGEMTSWNNAPERTAHDVVSRLRLRATPATQPMKEELIHAT